MENAFSVVDIKSIRLPGEVRDENILVAIVVKIAGGYTHSSLRSSVGIVGDTGTEGHILECSVALVNP